MKTISRSLSAVCIVLFVAGSVFTGCKKNDTPTDAQLNAIATEDAIESISNSMANNTGGTSDHIGDMVSLASPSGMGAFSFAKDANVAGVNASYDSLTGWWTVSVAREYGLPVLSYYSSISRTYKYQFQKNGRFQKFWGTPNGTGGIDTATIIKFKIVNGTGYFKTPRLSHRLTALSGSWVATNTNTNIITINSDSTYVRSGIDTITTRNAVRTLDHTITMNYKDVQGPRLNVKQNGMGGMMYNRQTLHQATSGTITGHFHADVSFTKNAQYSEKTIDKDFTITLSGGEGHIGMGGNSFRCDLGTGDGK